MYSSRPRIIISIGSNHEADLHIKQAQDILTLAYPDIRYSPTLCTAPIDYPYFSGFFLNCVAIFHTDESCEVVEARLKMIELQAGREHNPKIMGKVSIDIDLIYYDEKLLRPKDARRAYVMSGMASLGIDEARLTND